MRSRIFNFQRYSVHDGPGIRSVIFLYGCPLRCMWCCNPESFVSDERYIRDADITEIMEWILEDKPYFKNSGGGITLSGGEPLFNVDFAKILLERCKEEGIDTAVETCGDVAWDNFEIVKGLVDRYLYDIKHMDAGLHEKFTGSGNARILDNLKRLGKRNEKIYIRVPLIPGCNIDDNEAVKIGQLSAEISALEVHLLPYHRLGEKKYSELKISYGLSEEKDLMSYGEGKKAVEDFARIIRLYFKEVYIGG